MNRPILFIAAAALAGAGHALAHGTKHPHPSGATPMHAAALHSDENIIDRCNDKRYADKVTCLRETRSGYTDRWSATGASFGGSGGGMTGTTQASVPSPAQPNQTKPGQSGSNVKAQGTM